jgi:hypothetical protein
MILLAVADLGSEGESNILILAVTGMPT